MDDGPDALSLQDGSTAQVAFTLKLDKAQPATRATTWGDDYDRQPGEGYENRIDQLQVVLYSKDNAAYPLHNLWQETSATQEGGQDTYTFVGSIDTNDADSPRAGTYKIMVFANCPDIDEGTDVGNLAYTYTYKGESTAPAIPMWGVTTAELTLAPGERQTLAGGIDLLRAVAKVEVLLQDNDDTKGFSLKGVTLSTANTQGYCLPAGYAAVEHTKELDREDGNTNYTFHPYTSNATATKVAFTEDNGTYTLYLPEYDNGTGNTLATLAVTVADEDNQPETYTIEFKNYTNGQPTGDAYNIVRNHLYRYTITKIDNGQLTVQYRVLPWEKVTSNITYGNIQCELLPEGGDSDPKGNDGDPEARYCILLRPGYGDSSDELKESGSAGAVFQFKLTEPAGAVWTAHLSNTEVFSFSDSNITVDNKTQKLVSTGIARDDWYYIQINISSGHEWADEAWGRNDAWGKEVEAEHRVVDTYFYITISMNDGQEVELPINPQASTESHFIDNSTHRRFAGTESRIWIRQVPAMKGWEEADLAANINPTETNNPDEKDNFLWWRVNPYWAH